MSPEEKKRQQRALLVPNVVSILLYLPMVIVGYQNEGKCDMDAPLYLLIGGGLGRGVRIGPKGSGWHSIVHVHLIVHAHFLLIVHARVHFIVHDNLIYSRWSREADTSPDGNHPAHRTLEAVGVAVHVSLRHRRHVHGRQQRQDVECWGYASEDQLCIVFKDSRRPR